MSWESKIMKRRLRSANWHASRFGARIENKTESVRKRFVKEVKPEMSLSGKKALLAAIVSKERLAETVQEESFKAELNGTERQGEAFLDELERKRKGLKRSQTTTVLITGANKRTVQDFSLPQKKIELHREVVQTGNHIRENLKTLTEIQDAYNDMMSKFVEELDQFEADWTKELKKTSRKMRRKNKQYSKSISRNSSQAGFQRGELAGAKVSKQLLYKKWDGTLDKKQRPWHADMEGKTILANKKFEVRFPGGVDYMPAPKVNASPANYYNCRCVLIYQVVRR